MSSLSVFVPGPHEHHERIVGLIDEMHLAIVPVLLGDGERLFEHLDGGPVGDTCVDFVSSPSVMHARLARSAP